MQEIRAHGNNEKKLKRHWNPRRLDKSASLMEKRLQNLGFTQVKQEEECILAQNEVGEQFAWSVKTGEQVPVKTEKKLALNDLISMFEDELNVENVSDLLKTETNREIGLLDQQGMIIYG